MSSQHPEYDRAARVGDRIQRELAQLLCYEANDPRLKSATIAEVGLSRDLAHAKVYVTVAEGSDPEKTMAAFTHSAGFLRRQLSKRLMLRTVPTLRFVMDTTLDEAAKIDTLLSEAGVGSVAGNESTEDLD